MVLLSACQGEYQKTDTRFSQYKQFTYYKGEPFSGIQISSYPNGDKKSITPFKDGLKEGVSLKWYSSGMLSFERPYLKGKKHGIHRGWHKNGKKKFYYYFEDGHYVGETWQWFANGKVADYTLNNESDELVHKKWRRSGTIFWNTVKSAESRKNIFGLRGGGLCRKVEGEDDGSRLQSISRQSKLWDVRNSI